MFYEELMMDGSTLMRFKLFRRILTLKTPSYPIALIAEEMDLSYQQTVIELNEINEDLHELSLNQQSIIGRAGKIQTQNITTTIDEYRYHLLKKSVPFLYVLYLLNEEDPSIYGFCEKYQISRSTVSRKFEHLKLHLKQFNLRFTYTESNLVGDERIARMALFNILWLGIRGIEWPFKESEEDAERLAESFAEYFPLSRSYLGNLELKYFAALALTRIRKENFVKYDKHYNFLMKKNAYFDFERLKHALPEALELTEKQLKAESSFVFFIAQMIPFYTSKEDPALAQTLTIFSTKPNSIFPLVHEFINTMKEQFFSQQPEMLDNPVIIGNLINITFANYVLRQPFPSIYRLVQPNSNRAALEEKLQTQVNEFFTNYCKTNTVEFINSTNQPYMAVMFKNVLLPAYDLSRYTNRLSVGVALEENFLLVQGLYQFLKDLRFVIAEPFELQKKSEYDLVISSSQLLKNLTPDIETYLWDYSADNHQYIDLYQKLKNKFDKKNQVQ